MQDLCWCPIFTLKIHIQLESGRTSKCIAQSKACLRVAAVSLSLRQLDVVENNNVSNKTISATYIVSILDKLF